MDSLFLPITNLYIIYKLLYNIIEVINLLNIVFKIYI